MKIDIYSDVVCPWCYIGKRRLTAALASYDREVTIRFRPFQLDPRPVTEPRPVKETLAEKFGPERVEQILAHTTAAAAEAGLTLRFDRAISANTFDAHRLIQYATDRGRADEMLETLFRAHFVDGVNIGSRAALAELAGGVGLDPSEVRTYLDSPLGVRELRSELATAHEIGVTSVPTFVFAGKYVITGAQEPATLRAALDEVARRESAAARTDAAACGDDSCATQ